MSKIQEAGESIGPLPIVRAGTVDWKPTLLPLLYSGPTFVRFIKRDGSYRLMRCTLNSKYMPESVAKSDWVNYQQTMKVKAPNLQTVWDLERNGWRSFRWDAVMGGEICGY